MMRERIIFQTPTTATDGAGGKKLSSWVDTYECWAEVKPLSGQRALEFTKITGKIGYQVKARWQGSGVTPTPQMSVYWRGKRYTIQGAIDYVPYRHIEFLMNG
jgi:SPP1 family predicted phage head-tail adaptor